MGVGEDIRTLKEAIMVGRSYERRNVTTRGCNSVLKTAELMLQNPRV